MHDHGLRGWIFWLPLLVSGLLFVGIQTRFIDFNFAETTGLSQVALSWRGIQSTALLMASVLAVPLIWIALLFATLLPSQSGPNRYGPNPLEVTS